MAVLVTGGAGYIGSHVALHLLKSGEDVVILDNLSSGIRQSVDYFAKLSGKAGCGQLSFVQESLTTDADKLKALLVSHKIESVVHLAGLIAAGESVHRPLLYYRNNVMHTQALIEACSCAGVRRFVFSSSAAVYGNPFMVPTPEDAPLEPLSPYGRSKAMAEQILVDAAGPKHLLPHAKWLSCVSLRYFNVAGADPSGKLGYRLDSSSTHLIRRAIAVSMGKLRCLEIFGTDYPTPDGTCIRDYVHVSDIADAHVRALGYVRHNGGQPALNCGSGCGYSVREVVETVKQISGVNFDVSFSSRREGDPVQAVADISRIRDRFAWQPKYSLADMVKHQLDWEKSQQ